MSKKRQHPKYESITARWGGMDIRYDFASRIDTWLNAFHEDEKKLALSLLKHFFYYSEKRIKEKASRLYDELCKGCEDPKSIVYIPPIKQYGVGYSSLFFDNFWFTNNLYDCAERNILGLLENGTIPKRIAIVDDYAGTGMTIEKTLEEMICANESVLDSTIYVVVQHITKRALTFLQTFSKNMRCSSSITTISVLVSSLNSATNCFALERKSILLIRERYFIKSFAPIRIQSFLTRDANS